MPPTNLEELEQKFDRLTASLINPEIISDPPALAKAARERSALAPVVDAYLELKRLRAELQWSEGLLHDEDAELRSLAQQDLARLRPMLKSLERRIEDLLATSDPNDSRDVILEVRAGAGGEEAALFAAEILRMYLRYSARRGWVAAIVDVADADGGIKEAVVHISGEAVYAALRYESGVHRVQRVPDTEAQGRIHTSTVTVAVMPEAEEMDVDIREADIEFESFHSTGAGGQSVNTTNSAVRLTHRPTGLVVKCQQEKSQTKNRLQAMRMLRTKLYEMETERRASALNAVRRNQVGSGGRSEKSRTYNFPQDRLTDHRIGLTRHNLPAMMDGDIGDVLASCRSYFQGKPLNDE